MRIYLDTSVLAAIYLPERHTEAILKIINENQGNILVSRLGETEFYSVIAMQLRSNNLSSALAEEVMQTFQKHIEQGYYDRIFVTDKAFDGAIEFLSHKKSKLRTLDAIHLGCCALQQAKLMTADQTQAEAARLFHISCQLL